MTTETRSRAGEGAFQGVWDRIRPTWSGPLSGVLRPAIDERAPGLPVVTARGRAVGDIGRRWAPALPAGWQRGDARRVSPGPVGHGSGRQVHLQGALLQRHPRARPGSGRRDQGAVRSHRLVLGLRQPARHRPRPRPRPGLGPVRPGRNGDFDLMPAFLSHHPDQDTPTPTEAPRPWGGH